MCVPWLHSLTRCLFLLRKKVKNTLICTVNGTANFTGNFLRTAYNSNLVNFFFQLGYNCII